MGWASGSSLFNAIIGAAQKAIESKAKRKEFYREILSEFEDHDWDTQDESFDLDPAFDELWAEKYPGTAEAE